MDNGKRSEELRRRAEEILEEVGEEAETPDHRPDGARIKELLHELQVHQVELEVQNEELRAAQEEAQTAQQRYREIFEEAPVGYVVINSDHIIEEANREALSLFGLSEKAAQHTTFSRLIEEESRERFFRCIKRCIEAGSHEQCELTLRPAGPKEKRTGPSLRHIQLNMYPQPRPIGGPHYLLALTDITGLKTSEARLSRELTEKETLLKEVHHRTKNNLNVVSSLLRLQAGSVETHAQAEEALLSSCSRINSMVSVHRQLYESDSLARIEMGPYIRSLVDDLTSVHKTEGPMPTVEADAEWITLTIHQAVPLGLILNELITNSLKHAFNSPGETDRIAVTIAEQGPSTVEVTVSDNGRGVPEEIASSPDRTPSLGMKLVSVLTDQLEGELEVLTGKEAGGTGTTVRIRFPKREAEE
jgi:PAS domain S-box-containing protein